MQRETAPAARNPHMSYEAAIAINRFGLGARAGDVAPSDPKAWLRSQQARFDPRPPVIAAAPGSAAMAMQFRDYLQEQRAARDAAGASMPDMAMAALNSDPAAAGAIPRPARSEAMIAIRKDIRKLYRDSYGLLARARIAAALSTPAPFAERLTHFWANHFAVSADKLQSIGTAGTLEFEAVRPNLFGNFGDLLLAVETHPAMLLYLDQAQSIGPDSFIGSRAALRPNPRKKVGLNENLAREILELHTLGVGSGYTQADVQELARGLTGWSVGGFVRGPIGDEGTPGSFVFQERWHQPGPRTLLGKSYIDAGQAQARAMLADLAVHPATARHLATKLARHFAGDVAPPALVDRLAAAHLRTGGNLPALYSVLIEAPEIWATPLRKFKTPWEWTISALRGVGATDAPDLKLVGALNELGQPIWKPGSPAGWDDTAASWAAPDALLRRVEVAQRLASTVGDRLDARSLGVQLLPGTLSPATAQAIARADSPGQGLALLLVAPEFMRR